MFVFSGFRAWGFLGVEVSVLCSGCLVFRAFCGLGALWGSGFLGFV